MIRIKVSAKKPVQYYMHREDRDVLGRIRDCASDPDVISPGTEGCPAVWVLKTPLFKTRITKYWQFYLVAINYGMRPEKVIAQLGYFRAFCNGTGVGDPNDPRRNYITGEDMDGIDPQFDKDRTCSRSMFSGVEDGEYLIVRMLNGNLPPPMKPGKKQPETLAEINIDNYLYNPREHWDLFFACNIVNLSGLLIQFDGGALYPWFFNGTKPVIFMPHVSRETIRYPLKNLVKLPLNTQRVVPFTK